MKNPKLSYILVYVSEIIIGLLLLLFTNLIFGYMSILIGSIIILFGGIKAALSIKFQQTEQKTIQNYLSLTLGIILIFSGIFILVMREKVSSILPILFGAYIILGAILDLKSSLYLKKVEFSKWWIFLISIGILMTGGIISILNPFKNTFVNNQLIGVLMIIKGISDIVILLLSYIGNKDNIKSIEGERFETIVDAETDEAGKETGMQDEPVPNHHTEEQNNDNEVI